MTESVLRLIKKCAEFQPQDKIRLVPPRRRGLYVLYQQRGKKGAYKYDVVYVGMARTGIRGRLRSHERSKGELWTHFSVFEVWENIRDDEIVELEGLFRHLYRKDSRANKLAVQKSFRKINKIRENNLSKWS